MRARSIRCLALAMVFAVATSGLLRASDGAYRSTGHGNPKSGVLRLPGQTPGRCVHCHDQHTTRGGEKHERANPFSLFGANDNDLCFTCHDLSSPSREFPGATAWAQSAHATSGAMTAPDPASDPRKTRQPGQCLNCHDAHGTKDGTGVVPSMLRAREEALCESCHDGSRGADVKRQFEKRYHHPVERTGIHLAGESDPAAFGDGGARARHAECADCHNPHLAESGERHGVGSVSSAAIAGAGRVAVVNGPAGSTPSWVWRGPGESRDAKEYELCFKCHSSWTRLPAGRPDLALLTNPSNPSTHPIQSRAGGRIARAAFVEGWDSNSTVRCSDCHGGDDSETRGPHGSSYEHILRAPSPKTSRRMAMDRDFLCFRCHAFEAYADPASAPDLLRASRFNPPAGQGHAFHVGTQEIPCYACHESHGSLRNPSLIATGRLPGISTYVQTASGGSCSPTCHFSRSYGANYAR